MITMVLLCTSFHPGDTIIPWTKHLANSGPNHVALEAEDIFKGIFFVKVLIHWQNFEVYT